MDVLINQMRESFHNVYMSNHHDLHFKYLTILYVNYISIKMKLKQKKDPTRKLEYQWVKHISGSGSLQQMH